MPTNIEQRVWIRGKTRSGKTTRLIQAFQDWLEVTPAARSQRTQAIVLASHSDNQMMLRDQLMAATPHSCTPYTSSPLGFMQREVFLFWPHIAQQFNLSVLFPLRLRSETEQQLAVDFWRERVFQDVPLSPRQLDRWVRNQLDLFLLAMLSGLPLTGEVSIAQRLAEFAPVSEALGMKDVQLETWIDWRSWCLERGFLTYGILAELFGQHLLPHTHYQTCLKQRFSAIFADDVDEYPAVMRPLFEVLCQQGATAVFTENPQGSVRIGFGADPLAFADLAATCDIINLPDRPAGGMSHYGPLFLQLLQPDPPSLGFEWDLLTDSPVQVIQTTLRGELLRQMSTLIHQGIATGAVQPEEIAVITPGNDSITRYSFEEMLGKQGIALVPLAEQRPLIEVPIVGALLTLLAFLYDGVGYLIDRDRVAEMLTVLSDRSDQREASIDPVRAGILADHCYRPDPHHPTLLDYHLYPRWDRLGASVTQQYDRLREWITTQRHQRQTEGLDPPLMLDRALNTFFAAQRNLTYGELAALRELMETMTHYWEVGERLGMPQTEGNRLETLIQLLRQGTIAANPYPLNPVHRQRAVTLATVFQYRANHCHHTWQFWLDVGSPRWLLKSGGLRGAEWFLSQLPDSLHHPGKPIALENSRIERNLVDLLGRFEGDRPRLFLCHSDLATNGQEQLGPLLPLIYAGFPSFSGEEWV